ncbi:hypothetical protein [Paludisphaera rhizosphaerae]|uniref:hypothetical protein n=1 Tax=Paludisphaera rhizosphaerae TaxID=2711216 RepID=UPI0013EC4316|nr:hypothetical protein [Paludisphaera rhizosphaerae]
MWRFAAWMFGLIWAAACVGGCSEASDVPASAGLKATVSGVVAVNGKAVTGGTLVFKPNHADPSTPTATATVQSDGKYTVETFSGPCEVSYEGPGFKKDAAVGKGTRTIFLEEGENTSDLDF